MTCQRLAKKIIGIAVICSLFAAVSSRIGFVGTLGLAHDATFPPSPSPSSSAPAPAPTKLSSSEKSAILARLKKGQADHLRAMEKQSKADIKELEASQRTRRKEWLHKERESRKQFLAQRHKGPAVREYFKDYVRRLKALDEMMTLERKGMQAEQKARIESVRRESASRYIEVQGTLERGEAPAVDLWP